MQKVCDDRELCDLECLTLGAFAPLTSYMSKEQYTNCLETMKLDSENVFPMPIVCVVKACVEPDTVLQLVNQTGVIHANLTVRECWKPDRRYECEKVFGCYDTNHPYIQYMNSQGDVWYVSGSLEIKNTRFHNTFHEYRLTPQQAKEQGPWIGFQTRNPLHCSHIELIKNAIKSFPNRRVLLHPVEGVTQDCDIPFPVRLECYKSVTPYLKGATLSILPLSMRMAGPREAVWHALVRRNYGCSHFIVGRDHAGPSYKKQDGTSFYKPLDAQQLAKSLEQELGITIITSEEVVYCENENQYKQANQVNPSDNIKQISGTKFRSMLDSNEHVPSWYSYPEVITTLKKYYSKKRGVCFYFVGLSGSGKTTLAEALKGYCEELLPFDEVTLLDADIIRKNLSKGLGFSKEDRSTNVRRIGYVASEIVKHGGIVIVANIAPYKEDRDFNKTLITQYGDYVQFFVDTPIDECENRDVKGLYKLAKQGKLANFTGVSDPFEPPVDGIKLSLKSMEDTIQEVNAYCKQFIVKRIV